MTESAIVYTSEVDSRAAARELAEGIATSLPGDPPDALILFAAPTFEHAVLLGELNEACRPRILTGASSAGEFTDERQGEGLACVLALRSSSLKFSAGIGRGLASDRVAAARAMVGSFSGVSPGNVHPYRSALIITDALAGHADDLVEQLTLATSGTYQFFGGGAGDNAQFRRTNVFFGTEATTDAAVGLEILSDKPLGIGVGHGWEPAGPAMRVTEASGTTIVSLNGRPAIDAFQKHAETTKQAFDQLAPMPFFLHNILGIDTGDGHRLRVPLIINADGSITCAAEVQTGDVVHIMRTTTESAVDAATRATKAAVKSLRGGRPKVALFFDCVATRLRMGELFGHELETLTANLDGASFIGCNTHGQIARAEGQFGGFHNCTAVVCVIPE